MISDAMAGVWGENEYDLTPTFAGPAAHSVSAALEGCSAGNRDEGVRTPAARTCVGVLPVQRLNAWSNALVS